ncbi:esterase [Massilia sp. IC2-476]|uniref:MGH1-like glycoside hydrolase domain-containing protein n=1 Tax=Massilia sp. IC2-476 TaxID=2887199 RepID=UPI001D128510|nr:esterase [Massilia sp. IC2-476]MCC2971044.1 esterase [Massilia sp. IC2-476]
MKRRLLATAALLACLSASAQEKEKELYIRGAFNGWGTDNALSPKGKGVYEADILVSPGNHAFKVGSRDWADEWVADTSKSVTVAPGASYPLATQPGPEDYLFVRQTGTYRFTVDASNPAAPKLRVVRLETPQAAAAPDPHAGREAVAALTWPTWDGKQESARFSTPDAGAALRRYAHSTTLSLRDPGPQHSEYGEQAGLPRVRTGNLAFDALFALAGSEMRLDAVSQIRDGNYNGGAAIPCECFATGEKWHYVWTRDLSYAADLGLALLDPQRVRNSLEFKLSGWRKGVTIAPQVAGSPDGLQIVQDTGSGGSWPVSTDRVTWAFAAEEVLRALPAAERAPFARRALQALSNTIENDRIAAFDARTGLYTGEQSFLDWRDQSYASWIPNELASMSTSKSLSTNVGHYKALSLASQLAREQGDDERMRRYAAWAAELVRAINTQLWLSDAGMYSSLTAGHLDGTPLHKFDWLGQSLAIITGVASDEQARSIMARYPHGPMGAPVIWPQQPGMPVYHNRALWPFVTAYGLRAATHAKNVAVADAAYDSLLRGAALNMSNMENLEWLSGQPLLLDERNPNLIGPVINSRRQLWSVGAYLGMVVGELFGVSVQDDGVLLQPFVTAKLRREMFGASNDIALHELRLHGKRIDVRLRLPAVDTEDGYYTVDRILVNGQESSKRIPLASLKDNNQVEIVLGRLQRGQQEIRRVKDDPYATAGPTFAPREPAIAALERHANGNMLRIAPAGDEGAVRYNVYRDGKLAASGLQAGSWTDRGASPFACYAVEAQSLAGGNRSHHSIPRCIDRGIEVPVTDRRTQSNVKLSAQTARFDAPRLEGWGQPGDRFAVERIAVPAAGRYAVQVRYHNSANQVNLGISGGVKWLAVKDARGRIMAQGVVQLPHAPLAKANTPSVYSTPLRATLSAGRYRIEMGDFYNMSYLDSNSSFSAAGGATGPSNRFDIYGVRLLRVE